MPSRRKKEPVQAVKPDSFIDYRHIVDKQKVKDLKEEEKEETWLADLAEQNGWVVLKKYIFDLLEQVENLNKAALTNGATFEVIGQNYVTSQLARDFLQRVVNHVEDAREARNHRPGS